MFMQDCNRQSKTSLFKKNNRKNIKSGSGDVGFFLKPFQHKAIHKNGSEENPSNQQQLPTLHCGLKWFNVEHGVLGNKTWREPAAQHSWDKHIIERPN